jgi:hypothetical protein
MAGFKNSLVAIDVLGRLMYCALQIAQKHHQIFLRKIIEQT